MSLNITKKSTRNIWASLLVLILPFYLISCFEEAEPDGIIGGNGLVPAVFSFEPTTAEPGQRVTITGKDFNGVSLVTFNGAEATISSSTDDTVVAIVPQNATTGPIAITTTNGTGQFKEAFTVFIDGAPIVDDIKPRSAQVGDVITLEGSLMNAVSALSIGGVEVTGLEVSPEKVTFTLGEGTPFGRWPIQITSSVGISTTNAEENPFFVYETLDALADTFDTGEAFIFNAADPEISFGGNSADVPADAPFIPNPIDNNFYYIGGTSDTSDSGSFSGILLTPQQAAGTYGEFFNDEASQDVGNIYFNMDINFGGIPEGYEDRLGDIRMRFDEGYDADSDNRTSDEVMEYRATESDLVSKGFEPNADGWYSISIRLDEFLNTGAGGSWSLYQIEDLTRIAITSRRTYNGLYSMSVDNVSITKGGPINTGNN